MKIFNNVELSKYTTMRIGGIANVMYIPETIEDVLSITDVDYKYILGGGSNLLISDNGVDKVINLQELDNNIESYGNGVFYSGASVRLQKLIEYINSNGYGGIEYLFSVPGLVGGAICMNAGSGNPGEEIGLYVEKVKAIHNGHIEELTREECLFDHRSSIFKRTGEYIIIGVYLKFVEQNYEHSKQLINNRINMCKAIQDMSGYNFGSVFKNANPNILNLMKKTRFGYKAGCHYSSKTLNWIVNEGKGSYRQTVKLITLVKLLHVLLGKKCEEEVIRWE